MSQENTAAQKQTENSLNSMIGLVKAMPDGPAKLELEYALGLKQRPTPETNEKLFWVEEKAGQAMYNASGVVTRAAKPYKVMRIKNAKAQLSLSTFKLIVDNLEAFAEAGKGF